MELICYSFKETETAKAQVMHDMKLLQFTKLLFSWCMLFMETEHVDGLHLHPEHNCGQKIIKFENCVNIISQA